MKSQQVQEGPRSTWTFIGAIEQNQSHTAWGGRQRVSYDCSLRVKYMQACEGKPRSRAPWRKQVPHPHTYCTAPQHSSLVKVLTPFSILNTNTFLSNSQLSFVPFCSIFCVRKAVNFTQFLVQRSISEDSYVPKTEILFGYQNTPLHGAACLLLLPYIMKVEIYFFIYMSNNFLIPLLLKDKTLCKNVLSRVCNQLFHTVTLCPD